VELHFLAPDLASLDEASGELLACAVWSDARPSHGLAGLCDWRLAGRISTLERSGFVSGALGEVVLLPGKPRLTFDKLLVFGAGPRAAFGEEPFRRVVARMLATMDGLRTRGGVVELPGRDEQLIAPERAAELLLEAAGRAREDHVWTLVEEARGRERIAAHVAEARRRLRRAPAP
jgi:hypothetical protein